MNEPSAHGRTSTSAPKSHQDASDDDLVRATLNGDDSAYALLVQRYQRVVYAISLAIVGDRHAAQDSAQDAFVRAYQKLGSLRDIRSFGGWLLTLARRQALDQPRASPLLVPLLHAENVTVRSTSDDDGIDPRARSMLHAMKNLPPHEQRVLSLRYFDGHPIAAIAKITNRSVGTVTKQISRALQRLRQRMKENHHE